MAGAARARMGRMRERSSGAFSGASLDRPALQELLAEHVKRHKPVLSRERARYAERVLKRRSSDVSLRHGPHHRAR